MHAPGHEKYTAVFATELATKRRNIYARHKAQASAIAASIAKKNGWRVVDVCFVGKVERRVLPHSGMATGV